MKILDYAESQTNIALNGDLLENIGRKVYEGYEIDYNSLAKWRELNKEALELAMQVEERKTSPWDGAANVKYPLITTACIQFSSRVLPNIIKGPDVVKARVLGEDPQGIKAGKAERVSKHMSWQLLEEMNEWEEDVDRLFSSLPCLGCMFKKTYFDPTKQRNVSERILPQNVVVHIHSKSLESAARITHILELSPNEVTEKIRSGYFNEIDLPTHSLSINENDNRSYDEDAPHVFLEQHSWLDLDEDGYKEPYIVTIHKDTKQVARITARFEPEDVEINNGKVVRIKPLHYFTKYSFIPAIDGSFYDMGWGTLLSPLNKTVNQTLNQLLDAGTLANMQSGFLGRGIQLGRGKSGDNINFKPGEWKPINITGDDLRKSIYPLPVKEPSTVLYSLLGFMVDVAERLSAVTDVLMGESPGQDVPATTTLALIEQGLKLFGAIYKRIYRSMRSEYKKLFRLNSIYLNERNYYELLDDRQAVFQEDYNLNQLDILPVADVSEITDTQKLIKAQSLLQIPGLNQDEVKRRYLEALDIPDVDALLQVPEAKPDPEMIHKMEQLRLERDKFEKELMMDRYKILEIQSKALKNIADAESKEAGQQLDQYKAELQSLDKRFDAMMRGNAKV